MQSAILLLACFGAASSTLFPADQQTQIVAAHNDFRSQLARGVYKSKAGVILAKATNMQRMVWNTTLANGASTYAGTCPGMKHSGAAGVGENLYMIMGSGLTLTGLGAAASKAWADEFFTYGHQNYVFSSQTGHATQMAWATTRTVGCGYASCGGGTGYSASYFVVCRYYQPGNYMGQKAYAQGTTCSQCVTGMPCTTTTGLCG